MSSVFPGIFEDVKKLFAIVTQFGRIVYCKQWIYPNWLSLKITFRAWRNKTSYYHEALSYLVVKHLNRYKGSIKDEDFHSSLYVGDMD